MHKDQLTQQIKEKARQLGFAQCGIARVRYLAEDARRLEQWLSQSMHGSMTYMERYFDLRVDCTRLVPNACSVISVLYNYCNRTTHLDKTPPRISKYAFGKDYHKVVKGKLMQLLAFLQEQAGQVAARAFVDSGPVLEKSWAVHSGLGWIGKNGNLLNRHLGSFFFIGEIITDLELAYDAPATDHCGTCTACIDACPTQAILPDRVIDGRRCISYLTIELKGEIPEEFAGSMQGWMFGCDICQDVCPWNRFARDHRDPDLAPLPELMAMTPEKWQEVTDEELRALTKESALRRAGVAGIRRNLAFLKKNRRTQTA